MLIISNNIESHNSYQEFHSVMLKFFLTTTNPELGAYSDNAFYLIDC